VDQLVDDVLSLLGAPLQQDGDEPRREVGHPEPTDPSQSSLCQEGDIGITER
jgi:hypothetical protein